MSHHSNDAKRTDVVDIRLYGTHQAVMQAIAKLEGSDLEIASVSRPYPRQNGMRHVYISAKVPSGL